MRAACLSVPTPVINHKKGRTSSQHMNAERPWPGLAQSCI